MKTKSNLLILMIGLLSYQCTSIKNEKESIIQIKGEIGDISIKNLHLLNHFGDTVITLSVTPKAIFNLELKNLEEGYFTLQYGKEKSNLYLCPGDSLQLELSEEAFLISGQGTERNNYLKAKFSPEFNWYSNYYKTNQKGSMMVYYRDHYTQKLKQKLQDLKDDSQFIEKESKELDYEFANQLLLNQISLETNPETDQSIIKDLAWVKAINIENTEELNYSKNYISLVAKILISQNRANESSLNSYYNNINQPNFKTHFLSSLITPLRKELQFGEDDFNKARTVESFITDKQPKDSIGYNLFNLYHKFEEAKGKLASFSYEDNKGNIVSLEDFRGKYVYIDFWATWCVNCIKEFPNLKNLEERFQNEEIEFIGISIDKLDAKEKWKQMVTDKDLGEVQLFAPTKGYLEENLINDEFMNLVYLNSYYLGIPHYLLIDPEGKIVDTFFYRPSNKKGEKYIAELLSD